MGRGIIRRAIATMVLTVSLVALAACASSPPRDAPGITGTITTLQRTDSADGGALATILVEGGLQPAGAVSDKASVRITGTTDVFDAQGSSVTWESLAQGQEVEVWFDGPVAESYPVQGTAGAVRITR